MGAESQTPAGAPKRVEPKALIEGARVPELEIQAQQRALNARVRGGELSGPLLAENGRQDVAFGQKLRELAALEAIAAARILPVRPPHESDFAAAREADWATLQSAREEYGHIPDTPYMSNDHKGPTLARMLALEESFKRKWETESTATASSQITGQVNAILGEAIWPGALVTLDGTFDYGLLERALERLLTAEAVVFAVSPADPAMRDLLDRLDLYRQSFVEGLTRAKRQPMPQAGPPKPPPRAPEPEASEVAVVPEYLTVSADAPRSLGARPARKGSTRKLVDPSTSSDPIRDRQQRELDMMGPDARLSKIRELEAKADGGLLDPLIGCLAASLVRTHIESLTPTLAILMDDRDLGELAERATEAMLARIPPKARLGVYRTLIGRSVGEGDPGASQVAGALGASLLKQHPAAVGELVANTTGASKGTVLVLMTARLADEDLARLPKEAIHGLYKAMGSSGGTAERRQMARLARLANRR